MYNAAITITHKKKTPPLEINLAGIELEKLKSEIVPTTRAICFLEGVKGQVYIELVIDKDGEYIDSDEGYFIIR